MDAHFSDVCPTCDGVGFHRLGCAFSRRAPTNQQLAECALMVLAELQRRGNDLAEARRQIAEFHGKLIALKDRAREMGVTFAGDA